MYGIHIGGPSHCRICGGHHNSAQICEATPRQNAQISIEEFERIIKDVGLTSNERKKINTLNKTLRKILNIPTEPIYSFSNLTLSEHDKFQIPKNKIKKVKEVFSQINKLIITNGRMSVEEEHQYQEAVEDIKENLKF